MTKLKVLDLFAGIGGFSLGLERTGGFETVAFCEIDEYAQKVLKKHWPDVPLFNDVRAVSKEKLDETGIVVDVVTGGFPCQDLSHAGKQAGITGERSGLWGELCRIIGEVRPKFAIVENVPALLSGDNGRWFGKVLGDLAEIGYDAEWHCIPASYLGAQHLRDRAWIVAYPRQTDGARHVGHRPLLSEWEIEKKIWCFDWIEFIVDSGDVAPSKWKAGGSHTACESTLIRDSHGIPVRVDRLGCLGNAIVPQITELIGNTLLNYEALKHNAK